MRNATEYILMNKDVPYALFSCAQDEFGEESAILREWYTNLRPIGLQSLTAWLEKRRAPKRRKHMEQLLEQYGCVGLEGFLRVSMRCQRRQVKFAKRLLKNEVKLWWSVWPQWMHGLCRLWKQTSPRRIP